MGAFKDFITTLQGDDTIPLGGTLFGSSEEVRVVGALIATTPLPSIEALVDVPYSLLQLNMEVIVKQYELGSGTIHPRSKYILIALPPADTRVNEVVDFVFSDYWVKETQAKFDGDVESQYAPSVDGKRPNFLPSEISSAAYQAGYPTDAAFGGGNPSDIIWVDDYDISLGHAWTRQRVQGTTKWGIPISLNAGGDYEEGQWLDTIFYWVTPKGAARPARPVTPEDYNELPTDWLGTPGVDYDIRILTEDLYLSTIVRNPYGVPKSDWSIPILVSSDPTLTRYGNTPGNTDFLNDTFWRGYYTPGLDTHMASRPNGASTDWTIRKIDQESGEFADFVFKNFDIGTSDIALAAATPTSPEPFGGDAPNDCFDAPPPAEAGKILYMSKSIKRPDGSFEVPWSLWKRFDGMDVIQAQLEVAPGDTFFKSRDVNGNLVYDFDEIVLTAKLYKGIEELTTGINEVNWYRGATLIVFDSGTHKATNLGVSYNQYHEVSVDGLSLTINPEGIDITQEYTVGVNHTSRPDTDYENNILLKDTTDDGAAFVVDIHSPSGTTFKNQTGLYLFEAKFYKGGEEDNTNVVFTWTIKDALGVVITDGLKDSGGTPIGDEDYVGTFVYVQGSDIDQRATLELTATYGEIVRVDIISLTDVEDAEGLDVLYWGTGETDPGNPTDFTPRTLTKAEVLALDIDYLEDATGTWYRIERVNGEWGGEIKMRGEASRPNGGIYLPIFINVDFAVTGAPAAPAVPGSGSIIPAGWTGTPTALAGSEDSTYETGCLFLLRTDVDADASILTRDNYTPSGTYGTPVRKNALESETVPGADGEDGWTPVTANVELVRNGELVVLEKIIDWTGGTGTKPAADTEFSYVGPTGLGSILLATNKKGPPGNTSNFRPLYHVSAGAKAMLFNQINRLAPNAGPTGSGADEFYPEGQGIERELTRLSITNSHSQSRKFFTIGEVSFHILSGGGPVRLKLRVSEVALTSAAKTESNGIYSIPLVNMVTVQDIVAAYDNQFALIKIDHVITIPPGATHIAMISFINSHSEGSSVEETIITSGGYIEAFGL